MIETSAVADLFDFLVRDLSASGNRLSSGNREVRALLAAVDDLEPRTTTEAAGLRLLLTHVDEQQAGGHLDGRGRRLSLAGAEPLLSHA